MGSRSMEKSQEIDSMRNNGMLLTPTLELSGGTIPDGYKVCRCNLDHILCMVWDPIGVWEPTLNHVLKLVTDQCRLRMIRTDGKDLRIAFKENDFRYTIDKWFVMIHQNEIAIQNEISIQK
jgi:hypothetical protein